MRESRCNSRRPSMARSHANTNNTLRLSCLSRDPIASLVQLICCEQRLKSSSSLASDEPAIRRLKAMSDQLRNLLAMWFSVGLLSLERVTWNSPCYLLEKVRVGLQLHREPSRSVVGERCAKNETPSSLLSEIERLLKTRRLARSHLCEKRSK